MALLRTASLGRQQVHQVVVELNQETAKPGEQITQDVESLQLDTDVLLLDDGGGESARHRLTE